MGEANERQIPHHMDMAGRGRRGEIDYIAINKKYRNAERAAQRNTYWRENMDQTNIAESRSRNSTTAPRMSTRRQPKQTRRGYLNTPFGDCASARETH